MSIDVDAWRADEALAKCRAATRGIWIDALFAMHKRGQCGEVSGTVEQLAQMCRTDPESMAAALHDLASTETAVLLVDNSPCDAFVTPLSHEKNTNVTLRNRRMFREHKQRLATRERQERYRSNAKVTHSRARARSDPLSSKGLKKGRRVTRNADVTLADEPTQKAANAESKAAAFTVPDWLSAERWQEFETFRRKSKKPLTAQARSRVIAKLERLRAEGNNPDQVLEQTIDCGWSGVFPLKRENTNATNRPSGANGARRLTPEERVIQRIRERDDQV